MLISPWWRRPRARHTGTRSSGLHQCPTLFRVEIAGLAAQQLRHLLCVESQPDAGHGLPVRPDEFHDVARLDDERPADDSDSFIALVGAVSPGSALAFGLGGREAAADLINSGYRKAQEQSDQVRADLQTGRDRGQAEAQRAAQSAGVSGTASPRGAWRSRGVSARHSGTAGALTIRGIEIARSRRAAGRPIGRGRRAGRLRAAALGLPTPAVEPTMTTAPDFSKRAPHARSRRAARLRRGRRGRWDGGVAALGIAVRCTRQKSMWGLDAAQPLTQLHVTEGHRADLDCLRSGGTQSRSIPRSERRAEHGEMADDAGLQSSGDGVDEARQPWSRCRRPRSLSVLRATLGDSDRAGPPSAAELIEWMKAGRRKSDPSREVGPRPSTESPS